MKRILITLAAGACAGMLASAASAQAPAQAPTAKQTPAEVTITRINCGTPQDPVVVNPRFTDIFAYGDMKRQFVYSCYLIKHGSEYLLWDTGQAMDAPKVAPKESIVDQLAKLNVKPDQIKFVGISHYHADHTGQVASFPGATLLIGQGDWDAIKSDHPGTGVNFKPFEKWTKGDGKVEPQPLDKDVFGDGSVIMLATPGHTPGHHSLLVKLAKHNIVISGDAVHFRENLDSEGVPSFNFNRAETIASIQRLKKIIVNMHAMIIIQHDARDVDKLPAFPAAAK
jgi:glyoxylase-like metal-dependent hydrolase (beta-lactamase superfamily II)